MAHCLFEQSFVNLSALSNQPLLHCEALAHRSCSTNNDIQSRLVSKPAFRHTVQLLHIKKWVTVEYLA